MKRPVLEDVRVAGKSPLNLGVLKPGQKVLLNGTIQYVREVSTGPSGEIRVVFHTHLRGENELG
jgi:hypothetical protein